MKMPSPVKFWFIKLIINIVTISLILQNRIKLKSEIFKVHEKFNQLIKSKKLKNYEITFIKISIL